MKIQVIYQGGVFRPVVPIDLPEGCSFEFDPQPITATESAPLSAVYEVLSRRFESGDTRGAERHDEHQP
jgi:predicted DNA-binding antitoxin AbrB/MazE fold protein